MIVLLEMACELVSLCDSDVSCIQCGCVWSYIEDVGMTYSAGIIQVHNQVKK